MRLLILQTRAFKPNAAGVQRVTYKLGRYFSELGYDVFYYTTIREGNDFPEFGKLLLPSTSGGLQTKSNFIEFSKIIEEIRPDIIMNQMPYDKFFQKAIISVRNKYSFKIVGCLHNSLFSFKDNIHDYLSQRLSGINNYLFNNYVVVKALGFYHTISHRRELKSILKNHDFFVLLSPKNFEELAYFLPKYPRNRVFAIPNFIQSFDFKFEPSVKKKNILYVGSINVHQKRSDLLLPIWENIVNRLPDWNFIIVGGGPYYEILKNEVEKRGLERVSLMGHQNPEGYYKDASIFVMPSSYEGFPNVLLEAQTFGVVPVVFNSYLAVSWILNKGIDAFIEPPFDIGRMADRIVEIASDGKRRNEMAMAAIKNASRFHIDEVGRQWVDLFNTFISTAKKG